MMCLYICLSCLVVRVCTSTDDFPERLSLPNDVFCVYQNVKLYLFKPSYRYAL